MYSEAPNTQSSLSQKHVFPMNSPNCSHVSGGQAQGIIYSALDRLVILIIAQARKPGWQVGVTSVIFGSLEKVLHAFFSPEEIASQSTLHLDRVWHSYPNNVSTKVSGHINADLHNAIVVLCCFLQALESQGAVCVG